jgi:molybdate transport system regulatory protein
MARSRGTPKRRRLVKARVKVWLEVEGRYVFGYGMSRIFKAVEATGSIKAAARELGKSYRHVWGRIKQTERVVGEPLVETRVGGTGTRRSCLTPLAARLVADFDALRDRMFAAVEAEYARPRAGGAQVD